MSTNAAQVKFSVNNLTTVVNTPVTGISFVMGRSERGPFADPSIIINTWTQFQKIYGGLLDYTDGIHKIKRMLEQGASIRFCRVGHYVTISDASTLDALTAVNSDDFVMGANILFELQLKNPGLDGNKFNAEAKVASNGDPDYFNVEISHDDMGLLEVYTNLQIIGAPNILQSDYLKEISLASQYVNVVYKDLSTFTPPLSADPVAYGYTGGTDGTAPLAADYAGDSAGKNGFFAFDTYDDTMQLLIADPAMADSVHIAGSAYSAARKDLMYFMSFKNSLVTSATIITARGTLNIDSQYTAMYGGGVKITDPLTNVSKDMEAIGDIAALASKAENDFGAWYSFAGHNRGKLTNALGVVNNFGTPAQATDLDNLANRQVNMVINRANKIMLWGNFTGQLANNQENQVSIVRLIIFLRKTLIPTLEFYLEEPNDIPTWKRMYYTVKPFLDSLVTKRALFEYSWQGDQDAPNMDTLTINNAADVTAGKYQIQLGIKAIPSIQEISIAINLTSAGVSFEVIT